MKLKFLVSAIFLLIIVWIGYVVYAAVSAQPTITASWGYVDDKTTEIWIDAKLSKPLLIPASVENLTMLFSGLPIAKVQEFNYDPTGTDISMAIGIENYNLVKALVRYLDNDQKGSILIVFDGTLLNFIPVKFNLEQTVSENILAYLNFTAESQELAGGLVKTPALVETTFDWAGEEGDEAVLIAHMKFYNPNRFPVPIGNVSFDAYANDIKIGYGRTTNTVLIPANGYATLDLKMYVLEDTLPKVWELHVKNGEVSKVRADVFLTITVMQQEYNIKLVSYEETVRTDIMGELNRMLDEALSG
jgi:LEA14-like dessication related protein